MMDSSTDLLLFRSGNAAALCRLTNLNASNNFFQTVWTHYYGIIGKANEIIYYAEKMGLDDSVVKQAWAEAKVFRGRSYFELYKRYERLYLNTVPTTIGNIERVFKPSGKDAIFDVIKDDLDDAIEALDWTSSPGRWNKAVAKHIRAQVAMWEDDWTTAIEQCEDIFECPSYGMMDSAVECFSEQISIVRKICMCISSPVIWEAETALEVTERFWDTECRLITTSQYFKDRWVDLFRRVWRLRMGEVLSEQLSVEPL